jgi:hypothetical protein
MILNEKQVGFNGEFIPDLRYRLEVWVFFG